MRERLTARAACAAAALTAAALLLLPGGATGAAPKAPVNVRLPAISGDLEEGSTVQVGGGAWTGARPMRYSVLWQRCMGTAPCTTIRGATGRSHRLTAADVGARLRARVTARNAGGTRSVWSKRTGPVQAAESAPPGGSTVTLVDESWYCTGPVDLDLVRVTMRSESEHAVYLASGCTGRIGRIQVDTWHEDGIKVWAGAHDLVIERGSIVCHDRNSSSHQDGVQAQGGDRVTFRNLTIDCPTSNNAAFFVSGLRSTPSDIVCVSCTLKPANSTVNIKRSLRSGVRDSTVCRGSTAAIRIQARAVDPVDSGNVVLSRHNPLCA